MKKWFDIKNSADGASAEINIFGMIGNWIDDLFQFDGVTTAKSFIEALAALPESVTSLRVRLNSPGGDAFGGVTIANALRSEQARGRKVETVVEGLAASAASIVAMGGNPVIMADNAMMLVHAPWTVVVGNATDMRASADMLDQLRDSLVKTYQWHSALSAEAIIAIIDGKTNQGTWLNADDAIASGFATEKVAGLQAAASLDRGAVAKLKIPAQFRARVEGWLQPVETPAQTPTPAAATEVMAAVDTAGLPMAFARECVAAAIPMPQVKERIDVAITARAQREAHATEIRALCQKANLPAFADSFVEGAMPASAVKAQLVIMRATLDKVEIDNTLGPDADAKRHQKKPAIDVAAVYEMRRTQ